MSNVIAYYRVSTDRQRRSGLGIEAQRTAVHRFAEAEGLKIASEYVETETGKGADALDRRPQLAAALAAARLGSVPRKAASAQFPVHPPATLNCLGGHLEIDPPARPRVMHCVIIGTGGGEHDGNLPLFRRDRCCQWPTR